MSVFEMNEYEMNETESLGELFESNETFEVGHEVFESNELFEFGNELSGEVLNEFQETELAQELLNVQNEEELEEFLGSLIKGVAKGVGGIIKSPIGQALGGVLKNVAKTALPLAGSALGNLVVPGLGGMLGGKLGSMAGGLFEMELNELPQAEAEMEVARQMVRLASGAARHAAKAPANASPVAVARAAVLTSARRHAPGLATAAQTGRLRGPDGRFISARTLLTPRPPLTNAFVVGAAPRRRYSSGPGYQPRYAGGLSQVPYAPSPSYSTPTYGTPSYSAPSYSSGTTSYGGGCTCGGGGRQPQGRWYRRGSKIVLTGL